MIMLGVLAALYATGHETFVGSDDAPSRDNAVELAWNMVWAIVIYAVRPPPSSRSRPNSLFSRPMGIVQEKAT